MNESEKIHPSVNRFIKKEIEAGLNKFYNLQEFWFSC